MKKIVALILALAVLVGGWWYASPLMALDGLRDAAQTGNAAELEERVDFPRLRESIKGQLRTALAEATSSEDGALGAVAGAALGLGVGDRIVDGMVTPEWVADAVSKGTKAREAIEPAPGSEADQQSDNVVSRSAGASDAMSYDIRRTGFSNFQVDTANADGVAGPTLLFERDGLGWDLVGIEMKPSELIPRI